MHFIAFQRSNSSYFWELQLIIIHIAIVKSKTLNFSFFNLTILIVAALMVGCGPARNIVYFSNLTDTDLDKNGVIDNEVTPTIQPDDLLNIEVITLSAESNILFNQGMIGSLGSTVSQASRMQNMGQTRPEGYLVDKDGYINFPVIGKIKMGGLTKAAATDTITNILDREYVKDPVVNIRFLNFKVSILGEVNFPSTVTILTEKVNIMEAISLAGDLTPVGKRENVLIIREKDGHRTLLRVNLNDKELLSSPKYFLQQNDIVYVEPDSYRAVQASLRRPNIQFAISTILGTLSIATVLIALNK